MTIRRSLLALPLILAACSPSGNDAGRQAPDGAVRILLPSGPAQAEQAPHQTEGGQWEALAGGGVRFGLPGQPPLLTISCAHAGDGTPRIRFERRTRAEEGARALFAVEGNLHVARVPLDVVKPGDPGIWQGEIDARMETVGAIKGNGKITATLPGGGALIMPGSPLAGALLDSCRASGKAAAA